MSNEEYEFTQDWFHWAPEVWTQIIPHLPDRKAFLEIGSYEGRSTVWTIENMLEDGGWVQCVDTWAGGEEHEDWMIDGAETRFDKNREVAQAKFPKRDILKYKEKSIVFLGEKLADECYHKYDFIYIDGSHIAKDVLTDAVMAWPLLKQGGIMVLDDYMWGQPRDILHRPKIAIDAFTNIFAEDVRILHVGVQMGLKKEEAK